MRCLLHCVPCYPFNPATIACQLANLHFMKFVPGIASTLKNGDLIQFGTDTQVAIEVCVGQPIASCCVIST